jgi:hypothetical protein
LRLPSALYGAQRHRRHRTKAQSPQTKGICERFHKTILNEFYQVSFRKKIYATLEELRVDLDAWVDSPPFGGRHGIMK